jgi:putative Mg2+ transporter-C (MgtC) family protein
LFFNLRQQAPFQDIQRGKRLIVPVRLKGAGNKLRAGSFTGMSYEYLQSQFTTVIPVWDMVIRIVCAAVLGSFLGFEREWRSRPAGLRTHILVSMACAVFPMIAIEMVEQPMFDDENLRFDPIRLVEAITAGVAFLAAGFIIFKQGAVRGITTGAGMWLAASVGLAAGLGIFPLALLACGGGLIVLTVLRKLEVQLDLKDEDED